MSNLRIIYPNAIDDAELDDNPALEATLPVTNLADPLRERLARSDAIVDNQHYLGNFEAQSVISAMAIVGHNLTGAATYRLILYSEQDQTGTTLYDSGSVLAGNPEPWGSFPWGSVPWGGEGFADWPVPYSVLWFDPVFAASFDLEIDDTDNPDAYIDVSRLYMGPYWEPESNFGHDGITLTWVDPSTQERTDGGSLRTNDADSYRRIELSLEWLTAIERTQLASIVRKAGKRRDVFISCFPEDGTELERAHAGLFKFVSDVPFTHPMVNYYAARSLVLEEA